MERVTASLKMPLILMLITTARLLSASILPRYDPPGFPGSVMLQAPTARIPSGSGSAFSALPTIPTTSSTIAQINGTVDNADDPDIDGFVYDPAAPMPTIPGFNVSVNASAALLVMPGNTSSGSISHSRRGDEPPVVLAFHASNGTETNINGSVIYPVPVGNSIMQPFFQAARTFGQQAWANGASGNESNHEYFRYTAGQLSMVAIAYDNPTHTFNWGDFTNFAWFLHNNTLQYPTNNSTLSGSVSFSTDGTRLADIYVSPSFGDTETSAASGGPAHRRSLQQLHKRVLDVNTGFGQRMTIRVATTRVVAASLGSLFAQAYNNIWMDSGLQQTYHQYTTRSTGWMGQGTELQFVFPNEGVGRGAIFGALQALNTLAAQRSWGLDWSSLATTPAVFGEIYDAAGDLLGQWSAGVALSQVAPCTVVNPDGSTALGCVIRDEL